MFTPSQAVAAAPYVKSAVDAIGGPKAILGRLLGFGQDEMDVGVPKWAWFVMGIAAGGVAVWQFRYEIDTFLDGVAEKRR
jgi:hypothetical protein